MSQFVSSERRFVHETNIISTGIVQVDSDRLSQELHEDVSLELHGPDALIGFLENLLN